MRVIVSVMDAGPERSWTAQIVIACEHAGLKQDFKHLESEIYRVLARVDDPREVRNYLKAMKHRSEEWIERHQHLLGEK